MSRRKSRKKKNTTLIIFIIILLIALGILGGNAIMNGELLKNLKTSDEKKAEQSKTVNVNKPEEKETEEKDDEKVFTKKDDENAFKLVDKTVDTKKPSNKPVTEQSIKDEQKREELAISVVMNEWYGGEVPEEKDVYFSIVTKKSENVFLVEVRDKATTRLKSRYEVNVDKKEIVNIF